MVGLLGDVEKLGIHVGHELGVDERHGREHLEVPANGRVLLRDLGRLGQLLLGYQLDRAYLDVLVGLLEEALVTVSFKYNFYIAERLLLRKAAADGVLVRERQQVVALGDDALGPSGRAGSQFDNDRFQEVVVSAPHRAHGDVGELDVLFQKYLDAVELALLGARSLPVGVQLAVDQAKAPQRRLSPLPQVLSLSSTSHLRVRFVLVAADFDALEALLVDADGLVLWQTEIHESHQPNTPVGH